MTAEETAAMRESMEIQAITFAPQLLEALHAIHGDGALSAEPGAGSGAGSVELQIVFQINGGASPRRWKLCVSTETSSPSASLKSWRRPASTPQGGPTNE